MTSSTRAIVLLVLAATVACSDAEEDAEGGTAESGATGGATTPADGTGAVETAGDSTGEGPVDPGLAVVCAGEGSPAIVFEAGLSRTADDFIVLTALLDKDTTVCRYTRRGLAPSPPLGEGTRTSADWRDDLVAWMDFYGVTDPAVFVAHSAGGATIRMLHDSHPERIAGMVMIDTSQPQLLRHDLDTFPPDQADAVQTHADGANTEQWDITTSFATLESLDENFGDLPLAVLAAGSLAPLDFLTPEEETARYDVWTAAQMELAGRSSVGVYTRVEGAEHFVQDSHPEVVVGEIERVFVAAGG
jgi:pimeloyl-ACP methyl ester carboxylesterase